MVKVSVPIPEIPTVGNSPTNLEEIREGLRAGVFSASASQRRCKASFWARYLSSPTTPSPGDVSLAFAQEITGSAGLKKWWSEPGFRNWFLNRDEAREQMEYLFDRSLEVAEDLLNSDTAKPGEKVALIKFLAELAGKMPKQSNITEKFADDDISKMDENQLKAYLTKKGVLLGKSEQKQLNPVMEVTPISTEEEPSSMSQENKK